MRFSNKVIALLVLVAVAPLVALGVFSVTLSKEAVVQQTRGLQQLLADQTARRIESWFEAIVSDLQRASVYLPFAESNSPQELAALLQLPFRQLDYVTALVLLDGGGKAIVAPVYLPRDETPAPPDLANRARLDQRDLQLLSRHVPLRHALEFGAAFGPAYRGSQGQLRMVCAIRVQALAAGGVLAAEIALDSLSKMLDVAGRFAGRSYLLDKAGRIVTGAPALPENTSLSALPILQDSLRQSSSYASHDTTMVLGTASRLPLLGWVVLLEQPLSVVLGQAEHLRSHTLLWAALCLALALLGGVYLGRGVTRPVKELAAAASRIRQGDYEVQVSGASGRDELGQLASAFNEMARAINGAMTVIQRQKAELQSWNEELQERVEERTRAVRDALDQVIRSQKLGALGELGAGLAHEMNNSLTGLLGLCRLLSAELSGNPEASDYIREIVVQGQRIRDVVQNFQRFAESPEDASHLPLALGEVCREALALVDSSLEEAKIKVTLKLPDKLPRVAGDAAGLRQVVLHLIRNAVQAMPGGGQLGLSALEIAGAVQLKVTDTGHGIPADKLDRIFEPFYAGDKTKTHQVGLGLSVAYRIISEHHGQIQVRSTPGRGSEFVISLPGVREEYHLT